MVKKIVKAKRKFLITNEQTKAIFDNVLRPYLPEKDDYHGELNTVHKAPETYVAVDNNGIITVYIGYTLIEVTHMLEGNILLGQGFFVNQLRGMIMAKSDARWTNANLLDEFQKGMKKKVKEKITAG